MVATALLAARGDLPENMIETAMTIPHVINLPMVRVACLFCCDKLMNFD